MFTLFGGLVLLANLNVGSAQASTNRPPEPPGPGPIAAACCAGTTLATAAPAPPPQGTNRGLLTEPLMLTSLIDAVVSRSKNEGSEKNGPYLRFGTGVSGAGWIAVGPGYRRLFSERLFVDLSGVVSWRQFMSARARAELRPLANTDLTVGAQVLGQDWTQMQYFGLGQDSLQADRSIYRLRATDVSAYATVSPGNMFDLRARTGMLGRPRISEASGWHKGNYPDTQSLFTDLSAPGLTAQPRFWHADISLSKDTLDHPGHPTRGLMVELAASQFSDRDLSRFSFRRYELSTVAFVPLVGNLWTIGVRGTAIASSTSGANEVPFYMQPTLSQTVLRGFDTDRFRDRNLIALTVESRWAVFQHLDAALFADFGEVAPRFSSLNRTDLESSVGAGLRLHTGASTLFRIDAARTDVGGWRVLIKLHDSLSSSKQQRWTTVVPVVR